MMSNLIHQRKAWTSPSPITKLANLIGLQKLDVLSELFPWSSVGLLFSLYGISSGFSALTNILVSIFDVQTN